MTLIMCEWRIYEKECKCSEANDGHYYPCPFCTTEAAERICKFFKPKDGVIYKIVTSEGTCVAAFSSLETSTPREEAEYLMKELTNVKMIEVAEKYDRWYR